MPAIGFYCTDGDSCTFEQCFKGCRIANHHPAGRCMPLRTLRLIAEQREWTGKPSCTQLLKGTLEAYLEITKDYYIDPQGAIFRIIGTKSHNMLDSFTGGNELGEIRLELEGITGAFDFYDPENGGMLMDTKTYGSYKVMKALGLESVDVETGEFYKSGARKGQAKTKKAIQRGEPDLSEQSLQLNLYRMMLEDTGFPVGGGLFLDICVRDGGTYMAKGRGVTQNAYLLPVPMLPNDEVMNVFLPKRDALLTALETDELPSICSEEERWNDKKCLEYCNVKEHCPYGAELLNEQKEVDLDAG